MWSIDLPRTSTETTLGKHTEEALGATALFDDLEETGPELLDGRDMVGKNTHVTRGGGDVDLDAVSKALSK